MRRWIGCTFWLAAWSFWLWLGFGLYRELPRDLGPVVCRLPHEKGAARIGFVGDSDLFAIRRPMGDGFEIPAVSLFDATTGAEVSTRTVPIAVPLHDMDPLRAEIALPQTWIRHGYLFGVKRDEPPPQRFYAFNVAKDEWHRLTDRLVRSLALHPQRPWVALIEVPTTQEPECLKVVDLQDHRVLLKRMQPKEAWRFGEPFFLPDREALVCPWKYEGERDASCLELWTMSNPPRLVEEIDIESHRFECLSVSKNGRMAFSGAVHGKGDASRWVNVFDFDRKQFFSSIPASEWQENGEIVRHYSMEAMISPSGRRLLRHGPESVSYGGSERSAFQIASGTVNDIDTSQVVWEAGPTERVTETFGADAFVVAEYWYHNWKNWFPNFEFMTHAFRDIETGALLVRINPDAAISIADCNSSKTLVVLSDCSVRRLPFVVNYPLLALCQAILALPLMLLWAALRWRRNRRLRLAGVAP